jgi:hypothetical protein
MKYLELGIVVPNPEKIVGGFPLVNVIAVPNSLTKPGFPPVIKLLTVVAKTCLVGCNL